MLTGHFDNTTDESGSCLRQIVLNQNVSMNVMGTVKAAAKMRTTATCGLGYSYAIRNITFTMKIPPYRPIPKKKNWRCFSLENKALSVVPGKLKATAYDRSRRLF